MAHRASTLERSIESRRNCGRGLPRDGEKASGSPRGGDGTPGYLPHRLTHRMIRSSAWPTQFHRLLDTPTVSRVLRFITDADYFDCSFYLSLIVQDRPQTAGYKYRAAVTIFAFLTPSTSSIPRELRLITRHLFIQRSITAFSGKLILSPPPRSN